MIHFYYDQTPDKRFTSDTEGTLVQLCDRCAALISAYVQKASNGDDDCICELCDCGVATVAELAAERTK